MQDTLDIIKLWRFAELEEVPDVGRSPEAPGGDDYERKHDDNDDSDTDTDTDDDDDEAEVDDTGFEVPTEDNPM